MFIKVFATFCQLIAGTEICDTVTVADNQQDDTVTMQSCMMGQAYLVKFMQEHPIYRNQRFAGWKCQIGNRPHVERNKA